MSTVTQLHADSEGQERERMLVAARIDVLKQLGPTAPGILAKVEAHHIEYPSLRMLWQVCDHIESIGLEINIDTICQQIDHQDLWRSPIKSRQDLIDLNAHIPVITALQAIAEQQTAAYAARIQREHHHQMAQAYLALENSVGYADEVAALARIEHLKDQESVLPSIYESGDLFTPTGDAIVPVPEVLVSGMLDQHVVSMLYATDGAGKSRAAISLACSISTGRDFLGHMVHKTGPVIYIAAESREIVIPSIKAWCQHYGVDKSDVLYGENAIHISEPPANGLRLIHRPDVDRIIAELDQKGIKPALIVLDVIGLISGMQNEGDRIEGLAVMRNLLYLAEITGANVMQVTHTLKSDASKFIGAGPLHQQSSNAMNLSEDGSRLIIEKQRMGLKSVISVKMTEPYTVPGHEPYTWPVFVQGESKPRCSDDDVLMVISELSTGKEGIDGARNASILAKLHEGWQMPESTWDSRKAALSRKGLIEKASRGVWRVVPDHQQTTMLDE
jgi:AAA domain